MTKPFHDLPPAVLPPDIMQLKLELGDDLKQLIDMVDIHRFERDTTTYVFSRAEALESLWLPADFNSFLIEQASSVKLVDVCYDKPDIQPRPQVALTIYLENGERIVANKDPMDLSHSHFSVIYSTNPEEERQVTTAEIGYLISSLILPKSRRPDLDEAALIAEHGTLSAVDPTDDMLARYMTQLLPLQADSWCREEFTTLYIEDDNNLLGVTKQTNSNGLTNYIACFEQTGSERSPDDRFEVTANLTLFSKESTHQASTSYVREWQNKESQSGFGDSEPHIMDFMRAVIAKAKQNIDKLPEIVSYEQHSAEIISHEHLRRSTPDERE